MVRFRTVFYREMLVDYHFRFVVASFSKPILIAVNVFLTIFELFYKLTIIKYIYMVSTNKTAIYDVPAFLLHTYYRRFFDLIKQINKLTEHDPDKYSYA